MAQTPKQAGQQPPKPKPKPAPQGTAKPIFRDFASI